MKKIIFAVLAAAALFFTACNESEKLTGEWQTSALFKDGTEQALVESGISFKTENDRLTAAGNSGVNNFIAEVSAKNGKIKVSDKFASTKKMGSPEEMEFEDMFIETLINAESYEILDGTLSIKNSRNNLELQFTRK
ncbi:MAG: META domain-containing protein [Treponema sp.]